MPITNGSRLDGLWTFIRYSVFLQPWEQKIRLVVLGLRHMAKIR
jgi:hypothetical protein